MMHCIGQILADRKRVTETPRSVRAKKLQKERFNDYVKRQFAVKVDSISATKREHCNRYGVGLTVVNSRMSRLDLTFEQALKFKPKNKPVYVVNGISGTISEHLARLKLSRSAYDSRMQVNGGDIIDALSHENSFKKVEAFGIIDTVSGHAKRHGLSSGVVHYRMKTMSLEKALSIPVMKKSKEAVQ